MSRTRKNDEGLPVASSFDLGRCGHCPHVHIVLKDEDGAPFAVMVISNDQAVRIGDEGAAGAASDESEPTKQ